MSAPSLRQALAEDLKRYDDKRTGLLAYVLAFLFAPGFAVLAWHRLATKLHRGGKIGRVLGLVVWRHNVRVSGCHFSMSSELGPGLYLPHPTGMVIGDGVKVGPGSTLFQNITLGTGRDGYPALGAGVIVYAGAVIVGGISLGDNARVGANAFVSRSVAAGVTVAGIPARPVGGAVASAS